MHPMSPWHVSPWHVSRAIAFALWLTWATVPVAAQPGGGEVRNDGNDARLRHEYIVYHPFVTPANVSTLTATWTLKVFQPNETLPKTAPQPLTFTFTFTAPFHQVDNQQITDPLSVSAGA